MVGWWLVNVQLVVEGSHASASRARQRMAMPPRHQPPTMSSM
jgi:hypothetical protein